MVIPRITIRKHKSPSHQTPFSNTLNRGSHVRMIKSPLRPPTGVLVSERTAIKVSFACRGRQEYSPPLVLEIPCLNFKQMRNAIFIQLRNNIALCSAAQTCERGYTVGYTVRTAEGAFASSPASSADLFHPKGELQKSKQVPRTEFTQCHEAARCSG